MQRLQDLTPLFDVIRQHNPSFSSELAKRSPALAPVALGSRILGDRDFVEDERDNVGLYLEIATEAADGVKAQIDALEARIDHKLKIFGRIRLTGGVLTSFATMIVLGAIFRKNQALEIGSALVAFLSSLLTLFSGYIESFSGGEGSITRAKEDRILILEKFAQAKGAYLVAKAQQQAEKALESLKLFNDVAGRCLIAGARIGVKIHQVPTPRAG